MATKDGDETGDKKGRRKAVPQTDIPNHSLTEARRVPQALADHFAKGPATPLDVAIAMDMSLKGGAFKNLTGSAVAFGLTEGAAQSKQIDLTPLGRRVVAPTEEGDDDAALREAFLRPRVIGDFLRKYDGNSLPGEKIALNVLEAMGLPSDRTADALDVIVSGARELGFITEHKNKSWVRLNAAGAISTNDTSDDDADDVEDDDDGEDDDQKPLDLPRSPEPDKDTVTPSNNRVFITHGSNKAIVGQIKEILTFGKFDPIVSVEKESVAKPVPDKVLDDMRSCYAGIVHVGSERRLMDAEGNEHNIINQNVLIEIGAAMALYKGRFILLVERGVTLPSNLQGLYEVRYDGDKLDYEATMKLLKAFNEFRDQA
jgi:predicted nucleotide-binding protein